MTHTAITLAQKISALDWLVAAEANGLQNIRIALPILHPFVKSRRVRQIRTVVDAIAEGWDDLGNRVRLTPDLRVVQDI